MLTPPSFPLERQRRASAAPGARRFGQDFQSQRKCRRPSWMMLDASPLRTAGWLAVTAYPSPTSSACATRCNKTNMKPAFAADAARRRSERDPGTHADRKSDSAVLVMKAAEDRPRRDDSEALNRARERGIFAQRAMNSRPVAISGVGF